MASAGTRPPSSADAGEIMKSFISDICSLKSLLVRLHESHQTLGTEEEASFIGSYY